MKHAEGESRITYKLVRSSGIRAKNERETYRAVLAHEPIDMMSLADAKSWELTQYVRGQPAEAVHSVQAFIIAMVEGVMRDGRSRRLGDLFEIRADIRGTFNAPDEKFDPERHSFVLNIQPLKGLREYRRKQPPVLSKKTED